MAGQGAARTRLRPGTAVLDILAVTPSTRQALQAGAYHHGLQGIMDHHVCKLFANWSTQILETHSCMHSAASSLTHCVRQPAQGKTNVSDVLHKTHVYVSCGVTAFFAKNKRLMQFGTYMSKRKQALKQ